MNKCDMSTAIKKRPTLRERIKTCRGTLTEFNDPVLNNWLENTTIHGIVHVFKAKSPIRRIFWTIIFITAFGGCTYNVLERFYYLFTNPTATTSTLVVNKAGVPFPAVTVCNLNPIKESYAEENGLVDVINSLYSPFEAANATDKQCNNIVLSATKSLNTTLLTILDEGQFEKEEFIIKCSFGGDPNSDDYKNCVPDFQHLHTKLGKCYTFNSGLNGVNERYVKVNGLRFGLRLVLNIHQKEYLSPLNSNAGVKVSVQPRGVVPLPEEQGLSVPPGRNAYIDLSLEEVTDQTHENNCIGTTTKYGKSLQLKHFPDLAYSINTCKANSYVDAIFDVCSCLDTVGVGQSSSINCTLQDICCIDRVSLHQNRVPACPSACVTKKYHTLISYAQYPSLNTVGAVADYFNLNTSEVEHNLIALDIYFQETGLHKTETVYSYDVSALLSDLGGQLGLFLGASVISLLEFTLFVTDDLRRIFCPKKFKTAVDKLEKEIDIYLPQVNMLSDPEVDKEKNGTDDSIF